MSTFIIEIRLIILILRIFNHFGTEFLELILVIEFVDGALRLWVILTLEVAGHLGIELLLGNHGCQTDMLISEQLA